MLMNEKVQMYGSKYDFVLLNNTCYCCVVQVYHITRGFFETEVGKVVIIAYIVIVLTFTRLLKLNNHTMYFLL